MRCCCSSLSLAFRNEYKLMLLILSLLDFSYSHFQAFRATLQAGASSFLRFHTQWQLPPDHNNLLTSAIPTNPSSLLLRLTGHSTRSLLSFPKPLFFWRTPHPIMEILRSCFPWFQPISHPSHDPLCPSDRPFYLNSSGSCLLMYGFFLMASILSTHPVFC